MFFDQRGFVRACCINHTMVLGSVVRHRLSELWQGPEAERLRAAMAAHDYSLGCDGCAWQEAEGGPAAAYARHFDHLPIDPAWPSQMEFAMANTCNLACVMCNGEQSSTIRSQRERLAPLPAVYDDAFFADLEPFLHHLRSAKFLGGEPFLIRDHHRVWDMLIAAGGTVDCHVTTNGTVWNERVERVLAGLPVSLSVSIDGIRPATVAAIRVGADVRTILANLDRFKAYTQERGTGLGLTYCLMRDNWQEFDDFLRFADDHGLDAYVNVVRAPARHSLYRLPVGELAAVLDELERRDPVVQATVGQNRRVWTEQLRRLRDHQAMISGPGRERYWANFTDIDLRRAPEPDEGTETALRAAAVAELLDWAGEITDLDVDTDQLVVASPTSGSGYLDSPVDPVGRGVEELGELLESLYGRTISAERTDRPDGTVELCREYEDHQAHTTVLVRLGVRRGISGEVLGSWQVLAARSFALLHP